MLKNRRKINTKSGSAKNRSLKRYMLFTVAGILAASSIFMTVETATSGAEVSQLRQRESQLSMEKRNLEASLVQYFSINKLEEKSTDLGYAKPSSTMYVYESQEAMAKLP